MTEAEWLAKMVDWAARYDGDDPWHGYINVIFGVACHSCDELFHGTDNTQALWGAPDPDGHNFAAMCVLIAAEAQDLGWTYSGTPDQFNCSSCSRRLGLLPPPPTASVLAWADGTVAKLARVIYDERAFDRLPILADALTDAGCTDEALLSHLRDPGLHFRGCWALDLILAKDR